MSIMYFSHCHVSQCLLSKLSDCLVEEPGLAAKFRRCGNTTHACVSRMIGFKYSYGLIGAKRKPFKVWRARKDMTNRTFVVYA